MMRTFNIKHGPLCAFCRHWFDPPGAAIAPKNTVGGFWEYDDQAWNICKLTGLKKRSGMKCSRYQCKV